MLLGNQAARLSRAQSALRDVMWVDTGQATVATLDFDSGGSYYCILCLSVSLGLLLSFSPSLYLYDSLDQW